jgi:hypothetical protein
MTSWTKVTTTQHTRSSIRHEPRRFIMAGAALAIGALLLSSCSSATTEDVQASPSATSTAQPSAVLDSADAYDFGTSFLDATVDYAGDQVYTELLSIMGIDTDSQAEQLSKIESDLNTIEAQNTQEIADLKAIETEVAWGTFDDLNQTLMTTYNDVMNDASTLKSYANGDQTYDKADLDTVVDNNENTYPAVFETITDANGGALPAYMQAAGSSLAMSNTEQYWVAINQYRSYFQSVMAQVGYNIYNANVLSQKAKLGATYDPTATTNSMVKTINAMWNLGVGFGASNYEREEQNTWSWVVAVKGKNWVLAANGWSGGGASSSTCNTQSCIKPYLTALVDSYNETNNSAEMGYTVQLQTYMLNTGFAGVGAVNDTEDMYWYYPGTFNIENESDGGDGGWFQGYMMGGGIDGNSYSNPTVYSPEYDYKANDQSASNQANADANNWGTAQKKVAGETALKVFTKTDMIGGLNNWPVNKNATDIASVEKNFPVDPS